MTNQTDTNKPVLNTIPLRFANTLAKDHGEWVWDGLLFERDSITNPQLVILPNYAGSRLRRILRECYNVCDHETGTRAS